MTQFYTLQVQELLVDSTPCDGEHMIAPIPHISEFRAADVCEINSTVFPNLGSMTHSKVSGWLCVMQKQNCEKKQASRKYTSILRDKTWGEFGFTYCSIARDVKTSCDWCYCEPYIRISKHPTGTYTLHIYQDIRRGLYTLLYKFRNSPTSKAKYQLLWIKLRAVNEALGTKRFRIIIYFRVPT